MSTLIATSPFDEIAENIKAEFPGIEISVRKAANPTGFDYLNVRCGGIEVAVVWNQDQGFGLSSFDEKADPLDGLYSSPDEWYTNAAAVFHRVVSLLIDHQQTKPPVASISEIRQERHISQETVSSRLKVKQATYSKLERRGDVKVSSLKKVIEAMGGKLRIEAIFPDTRDVRELTFS